jgi:hypothetical protein
MLNLNEFLEMCDPNMRVAITNENGTGGAAYLVWPEWGWTAKDAIDNIGSGAYHVEGVSMMDGMLHIEADENPWDFGSYWEGEWSHGENEGYEVELKATMFTVESCEEDALDRAMDMFTSGDYDDKELRIVRKLPLETVRDHWAW